MSLDILAALNAAPARGKKSCLIQRWLDEIPADTPGVDQLVAHLTQQDDQHPDYRPRWWTQGVLAGLGLATSENYIGDHRAQRCACYR